MNRRLELLGIAPLDVNRCIGFLDATEDELHHRMGVYGHREQVLEYWGYRHFQLDWMDGRGRNVFRYIAVENSPHWPPLMFGELAWEFLRHFHRDEHMTELMYEE